jgi:hypothetical protein
MPSYQYECVCGVRIDAASDRGLETALLRHNAKSQIHRHYMHPDLDKGFKP